MGNLLAIWAIYILLAHYAGNLWAIYEESMSNLWNAGNLWAIWEQSIYCCHIMWQCKRNPLWIHEMLAIYEQYESNLYIVVTYIAMNEESMRTICEDNLWRIYDQSMNCWQSMSNIWGIYGQSMSNIWAIWEEYESNLWIAGNPWAIYEESIYCCHIMLAIWEPIYEQYEQSIYCCHIILPCIKNLWSIYEQSIMNPWNAGNPWAIYERNLWAIYEQYESNIWAIWEPIYYEYMSNMSNLYIVATLFCHVSRIYEEFIMNLYIAGNPWAM
jgi:hypothetical protein